jgi:hypothetical protein
MYAAEARVPANHMERFVELPLERSMPLHYSYSFRLLLYTELPNYPFSFPII